MPIIHMLMGHVCKKRFVEIAEGKNKTDGSQYV